MKANNIFSFRYVAPDFLVLALALTGTTAAWSSKLTREQRLADQIVNAILEGDPVNRTAGEHEFLGIYTRAETTPACGTHPDWSRVARP